ncbi:endolytic transglycosylase MltG [Aquihabitans sp. McL0605]|uniref:endolytic transglycosylase MltG n=1 Tax=Aquihabitans sp. McL0605 TaxID=3415671 RepID=UPI003CFA7269
MTHEDDPTLDPDVWSEAPAGSPTPSAPPSDRQDRPSGPRPAPGRDRSGPRRPGRAPAAGATAPPRRPRRPADEDEYFEMPHESRMPRWLAALLVIVLLVVAIGGGAVWWYRHQVNPSGGQGAAVAVQIPEGASTSGVADILAEKDVISSATVFNFYVGGKDLTSVQAGNYVFRKNSSFDQAIAVLNAGPKTPVAAQVTKVTIPEGYTVHQILERIHAKVPRLTVADLQAALDSGQVPSSIKPADQKSYEGLLFPATYGVGADDTAVDVLSQMSTEMESRVQALDPAASLAHIKQQWGLDLTPYDLVKVASMIQYEAAIPADAPKIGAVTYNRLEKGMPLQYDSTSIYYAGLSGQGPETIDYTVDTPYNTRTNTGLPPTPISSPGEYALEGAMHPADGPWLYFVLTAPKVVSFSESYDQFLQDKQQCIDQGLGCG